MYKIIIPIENETYDEYIQRIQKNHGDLRPILYETQTHHIIPRCMGGTNSPQNLIELFHEEHYYAHKLLVNKYPNNDKMLLAWWFITCTYKNNNIPIKLQNPNPPISAEEYAELRRQITRINQTRSVETWKKWREEGYERDTSALRTPEHRQYCSERSKKMWEQNKDKWKAEGFGTFKPHTDEWKKEHSRQMSENPPSAKKVILLNTKDAGKIFSNAKIAGIWQGKGDLAQPGSAITYCCRGQTLTSGRHPETGERCKWAFFEEE